LDPCGLPFCGTDSTLYLTHWRKVVISLGDTNNKWLISGKMI